MARGAEKLQPAPPSYKSAPLFTLLSRGIPTTQSGANDWECAAQKKLQLRSPRPTPETVECHQVVWSDTDGIDLTGLVLMERQQTGGTDEFIHTGSS